MFDLAMPSLDRMMDKFFLNLESVSGYHLPFFLTWKRGEFFDPGVIAKMTLRALTGHSGERPSEGILRIFTALRDWRVLVHFTRIWAPGGPKKISALANCSRGLKDERVWGTKFEILKNVKKDVRKQAL